MTFYHFNLKTKCPGFIVGYLNQSSYSNRILMTCYDPRGGGGREGWVGGWVHLIGLIRGLNNNNSAMKNNIALRVI